MEAAVLKEKLQHKSAELGIDKIGFTSADPFTELLERLQEQRARNYQSGFEEPDLEKRVDPRRSLPSARSIIAIALAYPARMPAEEPADAGARGKFCRASWGRDYHMVLRERLALLGAYLQQLVPGAKTESMVDTGALSDRAVAVRAGLGWSGKNTSLITDEFGSWVYLGQMLTDVYLPPDQPVLDGCGDCNLCRQACPTGALVQPGQLDAQSCLAFLTQTKTVLPAAFRTKLGDRLYGCDTCQSVCPKNRQINFTHQPDFEPAIDDVQPLLKPLLTLTNRQFKQRFGHMAGAWRGRTPIQRNALLALAHHQDHSAIPDIINCLHHDHRPVIRATAAWVLGQLGGEEAIAALRAAIETEQDEMVLAECRQAYSVEQARYSDIPPP